MYSVLVKNDDSSWDVIGLFKLEEHPDKSAVIDSAIDSGLAITGMETTSYKNDARINSVWDGSSFSGGNALSPEAKDDDELWSTFKKYSLLCDNKVIFNMTINNDSPRSELFSAAFASEVTLVKVPTDQTVFIGETYGWDGERFTNPA